MNQGRLIEQAPTRALAPARQDLQSVAAHVPAPVELDVITIRGVLGVLRRRKWLIAACIAAVMALALAAVMALDERYTAEAQVLVRPTGSTGDELNSMLLGTNPAALETEIQVLSSPSIAQRVIAVLDLADDADLNAHLGASAVPVSRQREAGELLERVMARTRVAPISGSNVLSIRFSSTDPIQAARVANGFASEYINAQVREKAGTAMQATDWLNQRISAVSDEVRVAERAVERFRRDSGLLESRGLLITSQQVSELNTQLVLARAERAEAEARLANVQRADNAFPLTSAYLDELRAARAANEREVAQLATELGERHPRMINLRARGSDIDAQIEAEQAKLVGGLAAEVDVSSMRETSLARSLDELTARVAELNQQEVQLRALERDAQASGELLADLLARAKETGSRTDLALQSPDARIVSPATVPLDPSYPPKLALMVLGLLGGTGLGLLLAFLVEHFVTGFRSDKELRRLTGLPCLAVLPRQRVGLPLIGQLRKRGRLPHLDHIRRRPFAPFTEAVRVLYCNALLLPSPEAAPKSLLVTSAMPREGKSTVAASLAVMQAAAGLRVLLVDADLRNPTLHHAFEVRNDPGLSGVLSGDATLDACLRLHEPTGVHLLTAGELSRPSAVELFAGDAWQELVDVATAHFDLVLVDAPPVRAGPEARTLARTVESTIVLAAFAATPREAVLDAIGDLHEVGARVAGVAMTLAERDREGYGGYGTLGEYADGIATRR